MGDALLRLVDRIPYVDILSDGSVHFSLIRHIPDYVDLQYKGVNRQFPIPVMEVTARDNLSPQMVICMFFIWIYFLQGGIVW